MTNTDIDKTVCASLYLTVDVFMALIHLVLCLVLILILDSTGSIIPPLRYAFPALASSIICSIERTLKSIKW